MHARGLIAGDDRRCLDRRYRQILIVALSLCTLLALSACGGGPGEQGSSADGETKTTAAEAAQTGQSATDTESAWSQAAVPAEKDEIVHAYAAADGTVQDTDVEVTLKNPDGVAALRDPSDLTDIVKGSGATFLQANEGLVWAADGKDVTYSGTSTQDLPLNVKITYTLDGSRVDPSGLAGANGHLIIRFDYTNNVSVQAGDDTVYTPLVALTALTLDNDRCSNVQATNAELVDAGSQTLVVGYAMPGLAESLSYSDDIDTDDLDIPDYLEVEADVTDFTLDKTVTLVSTDALSDVDTDFDTSTLQDALDKMQGSMTQLKSGAGSLADGASQLSTGAKSVADGVSSLASGIDAYTSGVSQASQGAAALQQSLATNASSYTATAVQAASAVQTAQAAYDAAYQAALNDPTGESVQALGTAAQALADAKAAQGQAQGAATALNQVAGNDGLGGLTSALSALAGQNETLANGVSQLSTGASSVADGASKLAEGAGGLQTGLTAFDQQGIQELARVYKDDVVGLRDRLGDIKAATYDNFSGIGDGTEGQVSFLIETDAIRAGE